MGFGQGSPLGEGGVGQSSGLEGSLGPRRKALRQLEGVPHPEGADEGCPGGTPSWGELQPGGNDAGDPHIRPGSGVS